MENGGRNLTVSGRAEAAEERRPPAGFVVDDDPNALRFARDALAKAGYDPVVTGEPEEVAGLVRAERPALVLLDLMLPGRDGLELFQAIPELSDLPVIFVSAYGRDETVARAFEAGADDYIVKPFSPTELVARVGAALRRRREPEAFVVDGMEIRYESREVSVRGAPVELAPKEFELLRLLSTNAGRWVHADTILRMLVGGLRRKLGDSAAEPTWIFNARGVGYRIPAPDGD